MNNKIIWIHWKENGGWECWCTALVSALRRKRREGVQNVILICVISSRPDLNMWDPTLNSENMDLITFMTVAERGTLIKTCSREWGVVSLWKMPRVWDGVYLKCTVAIMFFYADSCWKQEWACGWERTGEGEQLNLDSAHNLLCLSVCHCVYNQSGGEKPWRS